MYCDKWCFAKSDFAVFVGFAVAKFNLFQGRLYHFNRTREESVKT